jgi:cyclopropane-fatty-acyl-phospholipid synthase
MAGTAHAFERGWLSVFQLLAERPEDSGATSVPLTHDHIYRNESAADR